MTNPPHRVRDELDALRLIEFARGANQTEIALLDEIEEGNGTPLVPLGSRDHEAEICANEGVDCVTLAKPDSPPQLEFLATSKQPVPANLLEILRERIGDDGAPGGDGSTHGNSETGCIENLTLRT